MTSQIAASLLPMALPALLLIVACCSATSFRWLIAAALNTLGLITATASAALVLVADFPLPWQHSELVSSAPVSHLIAVLIAFLGLIIANFSRNYVAGEPQEARYAAMLHITLAAVAFTVLSNHLLMLIGGWVAISLGLHQLLLFYPERPRAALAAHKKFLLARTAELALLTAALILYDINGTWLISEIVAAYGDGPLSSAEQIAALLLAAAALIKCAQLPMHGWLIQVVEAPTPVSALLHAGIINLGGYLLILFAPLLSQAAPAQWLLLVVAGLTTVLASLIMTTRISIKVKLAWSTSAQMGLMLVECALGLYELAMLHLLAHACFKAYLFLSAGGAVEAQLQQRLAPSRAPAMGAWLGAAAVAIPLTVLAASVSGTPGATESLAAGGRFPDGAAGRAGQPGQSGAAHHGDGAGAGAVRRPHHSEADSHTSGERPGTGGWLAGRSLDRRAHRAARGDLGNAAQIPRLDIFPAGIRLALRRTLSG